MLVDTDVLMWYMKGNRKAKKGLDSLDVFAISAITSMDIMQGLRNKTELRHWKTFWQNVALMNSY